MARPPQGQEATGGCRTLLSYLFAPADRQRLIRFLSVDGGSAEVGGFLSAVSQTFIAVSARETQPNPVIEDAGSLFSCGSRRGPSTSFLAAGESFSGMPFIKITSGPGSV